MTSISSSGVLIFDADGNLQRVDSAAVSLLDAEQQSLFEGTAEVLQRPLSTDQGASFPSLGALVTSLLADGDSALTFDLSNRHHATARVSYGPDGANGVVVTVKRSDEAAKPEKLSPPFPFPDTHSSERDTGSEPTRLLERIAAGAPLPEVLGDLVRLIEAECPGMTGSVLLVNPETGQLYHGAAPNLPADYVDAIDGLRPSSTAGSCGTAVYERKTIVTEDITDDPRWEEYRTLALTHDLHACWSTPIRGRDEKILGTFAFYYTEPRTPDEKERALIAQASHVASIVIEHDRQERELQLQKNQFRRLVENAQPIIFLVDADGTLLLSEGQDLAALGVEPGEREGESIYDLYSDYETVLSYVDRALNGETVDGVIEMDGVVFDVWYAPYFDRSGTVAGCIGMAVDITERRETEAALRVNRDLLQRTQEMADVGGWAYNPETDRMKGTDETYRICEIPMDKELTLDEAVSLFSSSTAVQVKNAVQKCLRSGESFDIEGPLTSAKGTQKWVRVQGEARWERNETQKIVGTVQDLTERHAIEERLREQKNWLRSITENVSGGIYRSTIDGLVYANQAFLDLFGYESLEEMTQQSPSAFYADPELRRDLLRREQEDGGLDGVEVEYQRKDGSTFTGLLRSTQIQGEDGEPTYFDGVVTDITKQKARERKLRDQQKKIEDVYGRSEKLLRAGDQSEVAAFLVGLVYNTFGHPDVVLWAATGNELVPAEQSPPVAKRDETPESHAISGSTLLAQIYRSGEPRVVTDPSSLGSSFDSERAQSIAGIPIGEYGVLTLASVDTPEIEDFDLRLIEILVQKATAVLTRLGQEEQLRMSESRFRGLFEAAALGIALLDADGRIVEANPELASMFGYDAESLHGQDFASLTHPEDRSKDQDLFDQLVSGERDYYELEKRYLKANGDTFWGHLTVSRRHGPGEANVIGMVENVSDRKEYERELKQAKQEAEEASRLKSALLANMSHEVRTPLTSIIGFTGILRDRLSGQDARYAELAHNGGERLMDTLNDMLQLSKLKAGVTKPEYEEMDLTTTARQTTHLFKGKAETSDISLHFEPGPDKIQGRWPPDAIQRVLSNLLSNAIKFTPENGAVTVRVRAMPEVAVLEVEDTGTGISENFRPQLFEAFTQESKGLEREHEGAGLGLAIVKRFVELLDGEIDVKSRKGEGARFIVRLPL